VLWMNIPLGSELGDCFANYNFDGLQHVDKIATTVDLVTANGGEIVQPPCPDAPEIIARFKDPVGNILGLYQEPRKAG